MTIQTIKGIYSMVDDVLGGGNGNPEEVIVAVHHILVWIDENASHTDWRSCIEVIFNTYVEAFVYGAGRPTTGTNLEHAMYEACEYLRRNLGSTIRYVEGDPEHVNNSKWVEDTILDDLQHIFARA